MSIRIKLRLQAADLIAADRRASGRDPGHCGQMRAQYEACYRAVVASLKHINRTIDALFG